MSSDIPGFRPMFYLPLPEEVSLPGSLEAYWRWQTTTPGLSKLWGQYHWVVQTYLQLREVGFPCDFVRRVPECGVVISHVDHLRGIRPTRYRFLVALLVDRRFRGSSANLYVTHSELDTRVTAEALWRQTHHVLPWPQISLVPRDPERGDRFETIGYMGNPEQLASELRSDSFAKRLAEMGLEWRMPPPSRWNDFSELDCILAIRSFTDNPSRPKPALKLVNAWAAGVPAILGPEYSYRRVGRPTIDYLEACSLEEVFRCVRDLAVDVALRRGLVAKGRQAMEPYATEWVRAQWVHLLGSVVPEAYEVWASSWTRRVWFHAKYVFCGG